MWESDFNCCLSKLHQRINDVFKNKIYFLEKANGKIQMKKSRKYFHQIEGQFFVPK